jgi:hypothetical protein
MRKIYKVTRREVTHYITLCYAENEVEAIKFAHSKSIESGHHEHGFDLTTICVQLTEKDGEL